MSSHAIARAFLGHSDRDVTDTYIVATLEAVRAAVNRAAFSIDGTKLEGVTGFPTERAHQRAQQDESAVS